jgi:serine phosphatase RsbU (regulator of sigma subunit)
VTAPVAAATATDVPAPLEFGSGPTGPASSGQTIRPIGAPAPRFLLIWALAWAGIGGVIAAGIAFTQQSQAQSPVFIISVLFAEVVGFTALLSARMVFPLYRRLPYAVNLGLQVLTLFSGTVFGSILILMLQPRFSLARLRIVAMIVIVNAVIAVVVGIALHTYDSMRRQIEASYEALRRQEAMQRELEIAREVQRELLPRSFPTLHGLELAGACHPAVGVGGDYYDFLVFSEDQLGLVIADVSGKGIPAALLMAGLQASVRSLAIPTRPPSEVNRRLNEILYRSTSAARYATLFFGVYDAQQRVLTYSNAGHYPPLHLGPDGPARLEAHGIPIGLLPDSEYREGQRRLSPGDLLVLYTDGIIEARDANEQEFGETRLLESLLRNRDRGMDELVVTVLHELSAWTGGGPGHDDATIVLARAR